MKQADEITLKAFLIALEQLEAPLLEAEQKQLEKIAENITDLLEDLNAIAQNNRRLNQLYQEMYIYLQNNYIAGKTLEATDETLLSHNLSYESQRILNIDGIQLALLFKDFINKINLETNYQLKNPLEKDPECLIGLSRDELEALAESVLSTSQQEQLNSLLIQNSEGQLSAQETIVLDVILSQVDKLTILRTRARYTLKKMDALLPV
ncbi:hypothetical protein [Aliterella atlantica]|uniref:hypothetical protein n=1 Tax=Aliterella atlantica TaxID=1827278 RepID=UPI001910444A|nr:hypothetical protein [Aliterella atlantica]